MNEPYLTRAVSHVFEKALRMEQMDDSLSGATSTADALIEAIHQALEKATISEE